MAVTAKDSIALRPVTEARQLLQETQQWGMWTWASNTNKDRVRSAIESATAALNREVVKTKSSWKESLQRAYAGATVHSSLKQAVEKLKEAEDQLDRTTAQSKVSFAEAEHDLNAAQARLGVVQALRAIEIHERVLELARSIKV